MKILLFAFILISCSSNESYHEQYERKKKMVTTIELPEGEIYDVVLDSCEYLVYSGTYKGAIVHKGNCKNH